jgi:ribosomal-protein-alanine N-acetyltransferase
MQPSPISSVNRRPLRTARLDLEPLRVAHADEAWPRLNDDRMWIFFPELRPQSLKQLRDIYARRERGYAGTDAAQIWANWLARDRTSKELIGDVQATIFPRERNARIAYAVYPLHQRRGYAREAVTALIEHLRAAHHVRRIVAEMDVRNVASYRLAESLGFTRAGMREGELEYELLNVRRHVEAD